ncbi:uncharacterized protein LOC102290911, partial [Haplochromis burtoni]|uniref:uncharacterized protein LOC102290911 n=1 Tax=Haplochromis burtoni TaxID=8153 RepID=UPI001C2DC789
YRNSNSSSKYKKIISNSDLISSGTPAVYQLRTKWNFGKPNTRITFGEKNPDKTNKIILLVGETGAGKSTLINALFNYSMGVKWEEKIWFQMVEREKSLTESQTSDVIVYEIFDFEDKTLPYSVTIIDTPGYGNTRGIEHDAITNQKLLKFFQSEDGVHEVHAVGLVLKATDNRMNYQPIYVLDSVMSLFGKDLEKNIVSLITHSDGGKPKNPLKAIEEAKIKCARNENNEPVYFLFNNKQTEDRTEEDEYLQCAGKLSMTNIEKFTDFLEKVEPRKLLMSSEVLDNQIKLTACIKNLQEKIKLTEKKQTEIKQIQEALKKHEEEMT